MRGLPDLIRAGLFWMLALFGAAATARAGDVGDAFEQGVSLTREGRYEDALESFRSAQAVGDDSGRLQFNLGVVYYRLRRFDEARGAFERAAHDAETVDLAHYNLGLVALAAGKDEEAARWFGLVVEHARQPELQALAQAALERILGPGERWHGSFAALRGIESNVVLPVGAISDAPSSIEDQFWELRLGWADDLDAWVDGLGYHLSGLLVDYDEVQGADLGLAQVGMDWRGPVTLETNAALLSVDDSGYQRTLEFRMLATPYATDGFGASVEISTAWLDAIGTRAREAEGQQHGLGLIFDGRFADLSWNLSGRRVVNDRESVALSPVQEMATLRIRLGLGDWALRSWARYVNSDYRTERRDEISELGLGISWSFRPDWDLFVEGSSQKSRSSEEVFAYSSERVYGGLRLRF